MNYPDDNYKYVHDQILSELRVEYDGWIPVLEREKDPIKKEIVRQAMARLERRMRKL